jgi:NTE family protein
MYSKLIKFICIFALVLTSYVNANGSDAIEYSEDVIDTINSRPRIGLVLSGGGARGFAHIGVLKALEENRIPVDVIVGTSMGSIVGGLYAAGVSPDELEYLVNNTDWDAALSPSPRRDLLSYQRKSDDRQYLLGFEMGIKDSKVRLPQGLISGNKLSFMLRSEVLRAADVNHFDELAIPFRAVTTNIETGEMVVIEDGELSTALRASMAVPGAFTPVNRDGALLVDGGLVANLPVEIAKQLNVDHVIAVDIGSEIYGIDKLGDILGLTLQTVNVLIQQNIDRSVLALEPGDVLLKPLLGDFSSTNFQEAGTLIPIGYNETIDSIDRISSYQLNKQEYAGWLEKQRRDFVAIPEINAIEISGNERVSSAQIRARMRLKDSGLLNFTQLEKDLENIYAIDEFESVDFEVVGTADSEIKKLVINVKEKPWGPNYFRFGLKIEDDFEGGNRNNLLANHRWTQLNRYGAEWSNAISIGSDRYIKTELYQPINYHGSQFVAPRMSFSEETIDFFQDQKRVAEYTLRRADAAIDYGLNLRIDTQLRVGVHYDRIDGEPRIGDATVVPKANLNQAGVHLNVRRDSLDDPYFPKDGFLGELKIRSELSGLGSDVEYDSAYLTMTKVWSNGKGTFNVGFELGDSINGDIPFYEEFYLGGFGRLSGLQRREIRGDKLLLGRVMYSRDITVAVPGNAGISLETGNTWAVDEDFDLGDLRFSGALFWGFDTPLGAVMLSYGYADQGSRAFHMILGQPFEN